MYQPRELKKNLKSISFDRRRNLIEGQKKEDEIEHSMRKLSIEIDCCLKLIRLNK